MEKIETTYKFDLELENKQVKKTHEKNLNNIWNKT